MGKDGAIDRGPEAALFVLRPLTRTNKGYEARQREIMKRRRFLLHFAYKYRANAFGSTHSARSGE